MPRKKKDDAPIDPVWVTLDLSHSPIPLHSDVGNGTPVPNMDGHRPRWTPEMMQTHLDTLNEDEESNEGAPDGARRGHSDR